MLNLPNAITLLRFALIPLLVVLVQQRRYGIAFALFAVSALSDLADGFIARHWHQRTRLGAIADPLADKLTMLAVTIALALQNWLPWWFAAAVLLRDAIIVGGATAYHFAVGPVPMAPSAVSKLNTALEFLVLASTLAIGAGLLDQGAWWRGLLFATLATIVLSGAHYVVVWGRKATQARRAQG
jgi:cardiolipin synthase